MLSTPKTISKNVNVRSEIQIWGSAKLGNSKAVNKSIILFKMQNSRLKIIINPKIIDSVTKVLLIHFFIISNKFSFLLLLFGLKLFKF